MAITFTLNGTIKEKLISEVYIPQIRQSLVAGNFLTTKTDAKAKSLKIWGLGAVATSDWDGGRLTPSTHNNTSIDLAMDQGKSFSEDVHRVDNEASALDVLPGVLEEGAYGIAKDIDTFAFTELATTTYTGNAVVLDESNIKGFVREMGVLLDTNGAPAVGRALGLTPEAAALLAEVVGTLGSDTAATEAVREGFVGRYGGFDIFKTNQLAAATTGKWAIASAPRGGALGVGYSEIGVDAIPGSPVDNAWGATQFGAEIVKNEFVVKADIS